MEGVLVFTDVRFGRKMRARREALGIERAVLAEALGVGLSVFDAYEAGACQVSDEHLFIISRLLGVNIMFFYRDGSCDDRFDDAINIESTQ